MGCLDLRNPGNHAFHVCKHFQALAASTSASLHFSHEFALSQIRGAQPEMPRFGHWAAAAQTYPPERDLRVSASTLPSHAFIAHMFYVHVSTEILSLYYSPRPRFMDTGLLGVRVQCESLEA